MDTNISRQPGVGAEEPGRARRSRPGAPEPAAAASFTPAGWDGSARRGRAPLWVRTGSVTPDPGEDTSAERRLFSELRAVDSDPAPAQELAKAPWVDALVLSLGREGVAGVHTGCPAEGWQRTPGAEPALSLKYVLKGRAAEPEGMWTVLAQGWVLF